MANKQLTSTKITKRMTQDNMSIKAKLPSGASMNFSVGRSGERLSLAFSNDTNVLKQQTKDMMDWIAFRTNENNQQRFDRLENVLKMSKSGAEVMENIKKI